MEKSNSEVGSLDAANWRKIGKGILINLAGAFLAYMALTVFPQLQGMVDTCRTAVESCQLNPGVIWLVPLGASVVNVLKELLTDYKNK